jgi:Tfp pilus assembly protein PilN
LKESSDTAIGEWLAFLAGAAVAGGVAYVVYKVFLQPTIEEQQKAIQTLWTRIQALELRIHELERDSSQNEEEHRILRVQIEQLNQTALPSGMRKKLEELLALLDAISQRQHQRIPKNTISDFQCYVS